MKKEIKKIKKYYKKNKEQVQTAGWIIGAVILLMIYSVSQGNVPEISIFSADQAVEESGEITVMWNVDTEGAEKAAVYYSIESNSGIFTKSTSPEESGYKENKVGKTGENAFGYSAKIKVPYGADAVYLRAYAFSESAHMWTEEFEVKVIKKN